jgi:hypothetical protein
MLATDVKIDKKKMPKMMCKLLYLFFIFILKLHKLPLKEKKKLKEYVYTGARTTPNTSKMDGGLAKPPHKVVRGAEPPPQG